MIFQALTERPRPGPHWRYALGEAIIEDVRRLITRQRGTGAHQDALAWVQATGSDSWFSFEGVCAMLRVEPDYIRRGLLTLEAKYETQGKLERPVTWRVRGAA